MTQEQQTQLAQLEETIRQAQQQIEELKNPKSKKFEWKYELGNTSRIGDTYIQHYNNGNVDGHIEHGRYRLTKEVAEQSLARNKRANRLEALAEQLGGLKEFEIDKDNYIICYRKTKWDYMRLEKDYDPEKVYTTKACAIEICRMLNSNEFSLEGEL